MTVWIIPESDREGGAVCQFWLQGGKHNETPTDKNLVWCDPPWGSPCPPPPGRKEGTLSSPKNSLKKKINKENLTWLGGRNHNNIPRRHQWPHPA